MEAPNDVDYFNHTSAVGTTWLSDFAYHGRTYGKYGKTIIDPALCDRIYTFMDKYSIGKSEYGKLMDLAGREKGVFLHRLYGHHLIYDIPIANPDNMVDFLVHEFSDLFTKNGLPIIPGELLENAPEWLKNLTLKTEPCKNWNFINGFDLIAGTVAIFRASCGLRAAIMNEMNVASLGDFARTIGVGVMELAIAMSTANPLLLLGAILQLTAGVKGIFNDGDVIYMQKHQYALSLEFSLQNASVEAASKALSIDTSLDSISIEHSLRKISKWSFE